MWTIVLRHDLIGGLASTGPWQCASHGGAGVLSGRLVEPRVDEPRVGFASPLRGIHEKARVVARYLRFFAHISQHLPRDDSIVPCGTSAYGMELRWGATSRRAARPPRQAVPPPA